jgi:hypothetical protein
LKTFKAKPLITNPTAPRDMFTTDELELIKACVERYGRITYGERTKSVSQKEQAAVADLLRLARFQGYWPERVDQNGNLTWGCVAQAGSDSPKVVITIMECDQCYANFHAYHYTDEKPDTTCDDCAKVKRNKVTPLKLKEIPGVKLSRVEEERRIARLRRQEVPF